MWITPTIYCLLGTDSKQSLYVPSHNLFFPLNHMQQTCLTLRMEGTPANKPPGNWMPMEGGRISKCAYTTRTYAGSTLFPRTTVPQSLLRSLGLEMRLEKCLSTKHFTTDQHAHIQTFYSVIYNAKKLGFVEHFAHICFEPQSNVYSSVYIISCDWNMLTTFKCDIMMEHHVIAVTANFPWQWFVWFWVVFRWMIDWRAGVEVFQGQVQRSRWSE